MATSTTSTPLNLDAMEWVIVDDEGFVYKRQKLRVDPTALARAQAEAQDLELDPAILRKERRKQKRQYLLNLKERYLRELSQWDNLSNTLNAMQNAANSKLNQLAQNSREEKEAGNHDNNNNKNWSLSVGESKKSGGSLVDRLRMQVEAQEAVIRNFEQLCDATDSLCDAYEETVNQQFFDLPTWVDSPQELMASLCED